MVLLSQSVVRLANLRLIVLRAAAQSQWFISIVHWHSGGFLLDFFFPSFQNIFQQLHRIFNRPIRKPKQRRILQSIVHLFVKLRSSSSNITLWCHTNAGGRRYCRTAHSPAEDILWLEWHNTGMEPEYCYAGADWTLQRAWLIFESVTASSLCSKSPLECRILREISAQICPRRGFPSSWALLLEVMGREHCAGGSRMHKAATTF